MARHSPVPGPGKAETDGFSVELELVLKLLTFFTISPKVLDILTGGGVYD